MDIRVASTEAEIRACFPTLHELRSHLSEHEFVARVQRQMKNHGYVLVYIISNNQIVAAAGYRIAEFLAWGRIFYVDDLISRSVFRKRGYGGMLLDWLLDKAMELSCDQFHLDSGVTRHDAHRLYLSRKLQISSHHFSKELGKSVVQS
ncbi:MAG: GNAT family N-acetyltransferase [Candidatus Contendobacter sp.]|nr:GNAT family N-acetyltransferase [Candidatus Contendobacter sp.]MDS4060362.1 GNAT family N-acetyltransferase [Candidatus Contendobacter sp.]